MDIKGGAMDPRQLPEGARKQESVPGALEHADFINEIYRQAVSGISPARRLAILRLQSGTRMDPRLTELAGRVIQIAEQVLPVPPSPSTQFASAGLVAGAKLEAAALVFRAHPLTPIVVGEPPAAPARKELLTDKRMFMTVIGLISICLMLYYRDLSAEDQNLLMAAAAIAGLAGWASDHFKIDPPDKKG